MSTEPRVTGEVSISDDAIASATDFTLTGYWVDAATESITVTFELPANAHAALMQVMAACEEDGIGLKIKFTNAARDD